MTIVDYVKQTLKEDIQDGDITTQLVFPSSEPCQAHVIAKANGLFFGTPIIHALSKIYPNCFIQCCVNDGDTVSPSDPCVKLSGDIRDVVQLERTLLNFLQRLSGVATLTNQFVQTLNDPSIQILDTRKTTPLMRSLEKQAVRSGGGFNHRHGLYDMVLVKENHLLHYIEHHGFDTFNQRIHQYKQQHPLIPIEVEINQISLLNDLDLSNIDIILFDNMPLDDLHAGIIKVNQASSKTLKEVSGNINLSNIARYQGIDIDRISVGSLTHCAPSLDLSLLVL